MKTATLVVTKTSNTGANQRVYKLSHPLDGARYVLVSGVYAMFSGPETYIFKANSKGKVTDWGELTGSYRGSINHEQALKNAGFIIKGDKK